MRKIIPFTQDDLKSKFYLDEELGVLRYKIVPKYLGGRKKIGDIVGHKDKKGHYECTIDGENYMVNRLIWIYLHNKQPGYIIDHRDRNPSKNTPSNLREATNGQNRANSRANKGRKFDLPKGVTLCRKTGKFTCYFKGKYVGTFLSPSEAHKAYCSVAKKEFGDFFHDGS